MKYEPKAGSIPKSIAIIDSCAIAMRVYATKKATIKNRIVYANFLICMVKNIAKVNARAVCEEMKL
jgi:hypothetical protein